MWSFTVPEGILQAPELVASFFQVLEQATLPKPEILFFSVQGYYSHILF